METIVAHAQGLVYSLLCLMPSVYQKASLKAMMGLFLEAQGHALPQHTQVKSASSLGRFLGVAEEEDESSKDRDIPKPEIVD